MTKKCRFKRDWILDAIQTPTSECIIPPFSTNSQGYTIFRHKAKVHRGHRFALFQHDPDGFFEGALAAHKCLNKACVNPRHLYWATRQQNSDDKYIQGTAPIGEQNPNSKLTRDLVSEIRSRFASQGISKHQLSREYSVSRKHIRDILNGVYWK